MSDDVVLSGRRKVAALLISLGAEQASKILRSFSESDVEAITREIVRIERLPDALRERVMREALEGAQEQRSTSAGTEFARQLLGRALPSNKAADMLARAAAPRRNKPFGFMVGLDPDQLAAALEQEHPQTIALVLSHLPHELSGRMLVAFPPELRADITSRLAVIAPTDPERIREVESVLRKRIAVLGQQGLTKAGGIEHVVAMLGTMDSGSERAILDALAEKDPLLAEQVRKNMFLFEDIRSLDDKSIRRLLTEIRTDLPLALRSASDDLKQRIYANMSSRARQQIEDEMSLHGPTRVRDVEDAQHRIVETARALAEKEEIFISRGREDIVI